MTEQPTPHEVAKGEYAFARKRFVKSMLGSEEVARFVAEAAQKRDRLRAEIENLHVLAKDRHLISQRAARAYANVLPHRVTHAGLIAPTTLEKLGSSHGSDRLYKIALRTSKEYLEARDLYAKRCAQLTHTEEQLRKTLHARELVIERQLDSAGGHDIALQRDPLLNSAYKKMLAFEAELEQAAAAPAPEIP